jgi:hypothetical protein
MFAVGWSRSHLTEEKKTAAETMGFILSCLKTSFAETLK